MVRGANKRVIEVINTENEYFERVIFIVKNEKADKSDPFLTKEATEYIKGKKCNVAKRKKTKLDIMYIVAKYLGVAGVGAIISTLLMNI